MSITVTNPEGRNVEFKSQRGPTCGLYALSFVLEYLYDIKIPATADGDKTRESLRNKFKKDGKTVIGELYDATPSMADYIKGLESTKIKCQSVACDVTAIIETLNGGGLCMVPFCVDASGKPDNSGIRAHWCVVQKNVAHAAQNSYLTWMFYGLAITPFRTCWNPGGVKTRTVLPWSIIPVTRNRARRRLIPWGQPISSSPVPSKKFRQLPSARNWLERCWFLPSRLAPRRMDFQESVNGKAGGPFHGGDRPQVVLSGMPEIFSRRVPPSRSGTAR